MLPCTSRRRQKMKLIRFGEAARETPGIVMDDATRLDVSALVRDYDEAFFASDGLSQLQQWLKENAASAPRAPQSIPVGAPHPPPTPQTHVCRCVVCATL